MSTIAKILQLIHQNTISHCPFHGKNKHYIPNKMRRHIWLAEAPYSKGWEEVGILKTRNLLIILCYTLFK